MDLCWVAIFHFRHYIFIVFESAVNVCRVNSPWHWFLAHKKHTTFSLEEWSAMKYLCMFWEHCSIEMNFYKISNENSCRTNFLIFWSWENKNFAIYHSMLYIQHIHLNFNKHIWLIGFQELRSCHNLLKLHGPRWCWM